MIALGAHAEFIITAYVGVFAGLAALIAWTLIDSRRTKARLDTLNDRQH
jgi:heme exporter protein D